ncbi:MAG: alpha/beta hydrolase [Pseudomonadales bacterium]|nr:alpha/beta hydrolase [Pseudomonadales bacterium]
MQANSESELPNNKQYRVEKSTITAASGSVWAYSRWRPLAVPPRDRVVMHHSLFMDRQLWDALADELCANYNMELYIFDLLGHGSSSSELEGFTYELIQNDIIDVLETLQLTPCHYIGCSIGSEWGLRTSVSHAEYIKSLITIGPTTFVADQQTMDFLNRVVNDWRREGIQAVSEIMFSQPIWFSNKFLTDEGKIGIRDHVRSKIELADPKCAIFWQELWCNQKIICDYGSVQCPILVMCGTDDEYFLPHAEHLFSLLDDARLELIPDAGHEGPIENPEFVNREVCAFYEDILNI